MKFGNKKVVATIVAMAMATGFTGCSKDENSSVQSDSDTEKDLLTSSSSIDIQSAQESIDSSLNSYDTFKPIEKDENPAGEASSDDENPTGDLTDDGTSESGTSDGETSKNDKSESVTNEEFKAVFGYDIPEGATNITKDGYDMPNGHVLSPAALAARDEAIRKADEEIENGTYNAADHMSEDALADFWNF